MESSVRWSFFLGVDTKVYTTGFGVAISVVCAIGAVIMNIDEDTDKLTGISQYHLSILDKIGLTMFIVFEILMVLLLMMFELVTKELTIATWIVVCLLSGNFLIPILNAE